MTRAEPIQTCKHDGSVSGAQFSRDESHVLTWSRSGEFYIWECSDPLTSWSQAERILELEVRSGTTLDSTQNLRTLKFDEWQAKARSAEYVKLKEKLAPLNVGADQAGR